MRCMSVQFGLKKARQNLWRKKQGFPCGEIEASEFGAEQRLSVRAPTTEFINSI